MKRHLDDELKKIKEKLFKMALIAEKSIDDAITALRKRDDDKAKMVIKQDQEINLYEIEIDQMGHEMIALHQPAAADVRVITMVLKVTSDLDRIGDQAVNIAEKALVINQEPPLKLSDDLGKLARGARQMVRDALDAFMQKDSKKAKAILENDDLLDRLNEKVYEEIQKIMETDSKKVKVGMGLIMVSHNLERIGDLATNIAEDVIYVKQGKEVRHRIHMPSDS